MAKVTRALAAVVLLYALYLYTLPAAPRQAAPVAALSRETRILTLPALRRYAAVISLPEGGQARLCAARLAGRGARGSFWNRRGNTGSIAHCSIMPPTRTGPVSGWRSKLAMPPKRNCFPAPGPGEAFRQRRQMEAVTQAVGRLEELPRADAAAGRRSGRRGKPGGRKPRP